MFRGIGTLANVLAVIIGGLAGLFFKSGMQKRFQEILDQALGLTVIFIGAAGTLSGMLKAGADGSLETRGTMLLIGAMVSGALLGEWINVEYWMEQFGIFLKKKVHSENDPKFVDGFVSTSLVICVGAMAIVGAIQDGLAGDPSMLYAKAVLDGFIVLVFASSYGKGAIFSCLPIALWQGSLTFCARLLAPILSDYVIAQLSFVGSSLIFCVGVNLCFGKRFRVGNLLPALLTTAIFAQFL